MTQPMLEARRILCEITGLPPEAASRGFSLRSLSAVDRAALIIGCENRLHLTIWEEDAWDFQTLGDLVAYLGRRLADGRDDAAPATEGEKEAWYYE